jgi:hypothetical protein
VHCCCRACHLAYRGGGGHKLGPSAVAVVAPPSACVATCSCVVVLVALPPLDLARGARGVCCVSTSGPSRVRVVRRGVSLLQLLVIKHRRKTGGKVLSRHAVLTEVSGVVGKHSYAVEEEVRRCLPQCRVGGVASTAVGTYSHTHTHARSALLSLPSDAMACRRCPRARWPSRST